MRHEPDIFTNVPLYLAVFCLALSLFCGGDKYFYVAPQTAYSAQRGEGWHNRYRDRVKVGGVAFIIILVYATERIEKGGKKK